MLPVILFLVRDVWDELIGAEISYLWPTGRDIVVLDSDALASSPLFVCVRLIAGSKGRLCRLAVCVFVPVMMCAVWKLGSV